jgi:hypothetical protein
VEPWQVAKMKAQLQDATASKNPALLKMPFDAGHAVSSTRTQVDEQRANEYAFVLWRTGTLLARSTGLALWRDPRGIGRKHYDQEPTHC